MLICFGFLFLSVECALGGHRVLGNPFRSVSYSASGTSGKLCDKTLERGWYRFQIFGKYAEMPTECVQVRISFNISNPVGTRTIQLPLLVITQNSF